ncbi:hypothetical protein [Stratiformator vulcanicus]|uniref:DUF4376 domain-containing protein n=1 Tax=Stratiformator vulcanicus TaxID=2527980 RepID=A0A517R782_9PLAN|nr:hypothetical protein [Stratiformator vulcanicus]QDT39739.1 hypothetical protein Pan189_41480 [Stratiformator vulcanicus]
MAVAWLKSDLTVERVGETRQFEDDDSVIVVTHDMSEVERIRSIEPRYRKLSVDGTTIVEMTADEKAAVDAAASEAAQAAALEAARAGQIAELDQAYAAAQQAGIDVGGGRRLKAEMLSALAYRGQLDNLRDAIRLGRTNPATGAAWSADDEVTATGADDSTVVFTSLADYEGAIVDGGIALAAMTHAYRETAAAIQAAEYLASVNAIVINLGGD